MMTRRDNIAEEMPDLIDRLVCGELDESTRNRVLTWLEDDRARWRLCGLAFLEAQVWSQALTEWPRVVNGRAPAPVSACLSAPDPVARRQSAINRALVAAACVIAFGLGLALHALVVVPHQPPDHPVANSSPQVSPQADLPGKTLPSLPEQEPLLASFDVRSGGRSGPTTPIRIPVVPVRADPSQDARQSVEIPDYLRQQWERRGYKVSLERRFLFARLPNGERIVVPVEQLNVNPTPVRIN
jgi:hypothetical protein